MKLWHAFIHRVTGHFRKNRGKLLKDQYPDINRYTICDLGGTRHFWDKLGLDVPRKNITIFNISAGETQNLAGQHDDGIEFHLYDGLHIPVADKHYDLLVCNSVLEHVHPEQRQQLAQEMVRASKRVFCQTPAYSFPIEPHFVLPFIHWLPKSKLGLNLIRLSPWYILSRPSARNLHTYYYDTNLLSEHQVRSLFPGCDVAYEKVAGLVKSFLVTR